MRTCLLLLTVAFLALRATGHAATDEARARNLINSLGCKGCHRFEGSGSDFAPPLDGIGRQLSAAQIVAKLRNPNRSNAGSMMPSYDQLGDEEIEVLARFLAARR